MIIYQSKTKKTHTLSAALPERTLLKTYTKALNRLKTDELPTPTYSPSTSAGFRTGKAGSWSATILKKNLKQ